MQCDLGSGIRKNKWENSQFILEIGDALCFTRSTLCVIMRDRSFLSTSCVFDCSTAFVTQRVVFHFVPIFQNNPQNAF